MRDDIKTDDAASIITDSPYLNQFIFSDSRLGRAATDWPQRLQLILSSQYSHNSERNAGIGPSSPTRVVLSSSLLFRFFPHHRSYLLSLLPSFSLSLSLSLYAFIYFYLSQVIRKETQIRSLYVETRLGCYFLCAFFIDKFFKPVDWL